MTKIRKPRGMLDKFLTMLLAGEEKTIGEWAEEFQVSKFKVSKMLQRLRQHYGFHQFHPIGTKFGPGLSAPGIVVDINQNKEWILETMEHQKRNSIDPQLKAFADWIEKGYRKYPSLRQNFRSYLSNELTRLTLIDEGLK